MNVLNSQVDNFKTSNKLAIFVCSDNQKEHRIEKFTDEIANSFTEPKSMTFEAKKMAYFATRNIIQITPEVQKFSRLCIVSYCNPTKNS